MHIAPLFSRLIAAGAIGAVAANCSTAAFAQDTIKVGAPLPLTGPLSPEGLKQKRGYDLWAETANAKGGIKAGGKTYKVEIVYVDYASNTPRAVQSAERLITEDKVQLPVLPRSAPARPRRQAASRRSTASRRSRRPHRRRRSTTRATSSCSARFTPNDTLTEPLAEIVTEKNKQHQTGRDPRAQRPVPARDRAGIREVGEGAGTSRW